MVQMGQRKKKWNIRNDRTLQGQKRSGTSINVVVTSNSKAAFVAQANGNGVHFKGTPKY